MIGPADSRPGSQRRGFTVLEVGITFALSVILVALGVMMFSALLKAHQYTLQRDRVRSEWMRVDTHLRRDAHAATNGEVMSKTSCSLRDGNGRSWSYLPHEAGLVREVRQGDELKQRELFHLPKETQIEFATEQVHSRTMLQLKLKPPEKLGRLGGRLPAYEGRILIGGLRPEGEKGGQR